MKYFLFLVLILPSFACASAEKKVTKDPSKIVAPFDGERFDNIEPFPDKSFWKDVLGWQIKRLFTVPSWDRVKDQKFYSATQPSSKELQTAVIGHSTVLIQMDDVNILTDPHYSKRSSPFSWIGPKRVTQPGIDFLSLPPIDIVVISHDHYDHLDLPTLKRLSENHSPNIYVGLGNKKMMKEYGIKNVIEMDWWDGITYKGIKIQMVPVQHWSARSTDDRRTTLWGGFVFHGSKKVFFVGDSGYGTGKVFKMIHERIGDMDLSLIPIGAYMPRKFMKNNHVWPEESVKIHQDVKSKQSVGIHFGTFSDLTDESIDDPPKRLKKALEAAGIPESSFIVPELGKTYNFN